MRLLVAHPSATLRARVRAVLEPLGDEVLECSCGADALDACRTEGVEAIVADGALARRGTPSLIAQIKTDPDLYRTALVLVEGEIGLPEAVVELRRGVHDFLVEPFSDAELVGAVRSAERTRILQDQLMARSRQLEELAFSDPLTGLDNRRSMLRRLEAAISGARRHGRPLAVAMLDIDHFKAINDTHGHELGDAVLVLLARRMVDRLRQEDVVGRLGGEEFLVLLPDTDEAAAETVVESLRHAVADAPLVASGRPVRVTVSAGWAVWAGEDGEELVRRSDEALYAAKAAGRNAVRAATA